MKKVIFILLLIAPVFILIFCTASTTKNKIAGASVSAKGFAVVELFTSQGCSSCPPADRLLEKFTNKENVYALSFHVDYWDKGGWKDPFSEAAFTQRQSMYAHLLNADVYTPQAIVNGEKEMVGSDEENLNSAVNKFLSSPSNVQINVSNVKPAVTSVSFDYQLQGKFGDAVLNAALVQNKIITTVKAGENEGLNLTNFNVVRIFKTVNADNKSNSISFQLPAGYNKNDLSIILFLQLKNTQKIISAAKVSL